MRNFRKAALAGATAVAVAFGSTAVATAEDKQLDQAQTKETNFLGIKEGKDAWDGLVRLGSEDKGVDVLDPNKEKNDNWALGYNIFGANNDLANEPTWVKVFYGLSIFLGVSALVGLIVGPAYNFIVHGPVNL